MDRKWIFVFILGVAVLAAGCQGNQTRVGEGAVIGGVLGAAAGGIIGHQSHSDSQGAGIGAAVGAITGAIIGAQMEKPGAGQTAQNTAPIQQNNPNQMTIGQIVELAKQGAHESVIIDKILLTNSKFSLSADDISYLRQQGVSSRVIDAMQGH